MVPRTKVQAAAFAVSAAALGALILVIAQAIAIVHCPVVVP